MSSLIVESQVFNWPPVLHFQPRHGWAVSIILLNSSFSFLATLPSHWRRRLRSKEPSRSILWHRIRRLLFGSRSDLLVRDMTRRHQWSNTSSFCTSASLTAHVSQPYNKVERTTLLYTRILVRRLTSVRLQRPLRSPMNAFLALLMRDSNSWFV